MSIPAYGVTFNAFRTRFNSFLKTPGVSNTAWLISDRILRMGIGLVVGVWVARYLGPEGYGQLSFAGSYVMLFSAIALFGLESIVVRELVIHADERDAILGTSCMIRLFAGIASYLIALTILFVLRPDDRLILIMVALLGSSLVLQALDVADLWFQSQIASYFSVISRFSAFFVSSVVKISMVLAGASITSITIATASEIFFAAIALGISYRLSGAKIGRWRWSSEWFQKLLSGSVPMVFSGIVLMVYLRIDQVMLGALASEAEVGFYAAAVRISEVWYFVPTAIVSSVFPGLIKLREIDETLFNQKLQRLYNLMAFLGYAVAIPVTFVSPWLVKLLFGVAYQPSSQLLAVLIWAGLFANLTVVRNAHFIAIERGRALLWCTTLGASFNVLLNLILIPRYGAMGAAISTSVSYWVAAHGASYTVCTMRPVGKMVLRALLYPRFW